MVEISSYTKQGNLTPGEIARSAGNGSSYGNLPDPLTPPVVDIEAAATKALDYAKTNDAARAAALQRKQARIASDTAQNNSTNQSRVYQPSNDTPDPLAPVKFSEEFYREAIQRAHDDALLAAPPMVRELMPEVEVKTGSDSTEVELKKPTGDPYTDWSEDLYELQTEYAPEVLNLYDQIRKNKITPADALKEVMKHFTQPEENSHPDDRYEGVSELRQEWGKDYEANMELVRVYFNEYIPDREKDKYDTADGARKLLPYAKNVLRRK